MKSLDDRVCVAETLCKQTLANSSQTGQTRSSGALHINPEAVNKCVNDVIFLAKALSTDESLYFEAVSYIYGGAKQVAIDIN